LFLTLGRDYRRLARILCGLIVAVWIYRAVLFFGFHVREVYFYEAFDTRADHLLIGCLLAVTLRADWSGLLDANVRAAWTAVAVAGLLAVSNVMEFKYGTDYRDTIGFIANPLLTAVWIAQLIGMRNPCSGAG